MSWMLLWKILLIAVLAVFSVMALLVTVLGARDVGKLIRALKNKEE